MIAEYCSDADFWLSFHTPALAYHFDKTLEHVEILSKVIEADARADRPSQMRNLLSWLSFDIMGDFIFSKSFDMLSGQEWHHVVVRLKNALSLLGIASPAPWLIQLAFRIGPPIWKIGDWHKSAAWIHKQIGARLETSFDKKFKPDLVYYLMEQNGVSRTPENVLRMRGDSLNAIVAGRFVITIQGG